MCLPEHFLPGPHYLSSRCQIQINTSCLCKTLLMDNFIHNHLLLSSVSVAHSATFWGSLMPRLAPSSHLKTLLNWEHEGYHPPSSDTFNSNDVYIQTTNTNILPFMSYLSLPGQGRPLQSSPMVSS